MRSGLAPLAAALLLAAPLGARDETGSLEKFLERARAEREARFAELRPVVVRVVAELQDLDPEEDSEVADHYVAELSALGPDATPLLVPYLEPGALEGSGGLERSRHVARALAATDCDPITGDLLELARSGSQEARRNAVQILGNVSDSERVTPALAELYVTANLPVRLAAVEALAELGGELSTGILRDALVDEEAAVVATTLGALARHAFVEMDDAVLAVVRSDMGGDVVPELIAYFRAIAGEVENDHIDDLVALAARDALRKTDRIRLLDVLPEFGGRLERGWEDALEPLLTGSDGEVKEEAQICLARMGSSQARREILDAYDEMVDADPRWFQTYRRRADLYLRLDEHRQAIRDYRKALELHRGNASSKREVWVGLARAYVLDGNLRQAHEALTEGEIGKTTLGILAEDPDFAPLVEHSNYGKLFPTED